MKRTAALCALLLALQARAGGYTLGGALGGGTARSDSWSSGGPLLSQPAWNWDADLGFGGTPFVPGLLQFMARGQYRSQWLGAPEGSTSARGLGYTLNLSLLADSPLPGNFSAARTLSDFSADTTIQRTGSTLVSTETGSVLLRNAGYPTLRVAMTRTNLDNQSFAAPQTTAGSTLLSVTASHSTPRQEFSTSYDTGWNDGSYAETNYRSHSAQAWASTDITDELRFRLAERYFLRLPTLDAATNPRYDDNTFGAGLQWRRSDRLNSSLDYSNRHLVVTAPGAADLEQQDQSVRANTAYRWTDAVTVNGVADVEASRERQDGHSRAGDAATAGGGLTWRRLVRPGVELMAGAGGSAGGAQPMDGDLQFAYGASASAGISAAGELARASANYSGTYQRNTSGLPGWSISQQLNLTGDAVVRATLFRATALFSDARREDPLLGTFSNRAVSLAVSATWGTTGAQASIGQSDGVSEALAEPGAGLLLPATFNTRNRYGMLSAGLRVPGTRVILTALARTLSTEAPDRPIRHEHGGSLTASYAIGAMTFSFEDRLSTGGSGGAWQTGNLVLLRAMRTFGGPL